MKNTKKRIIITAVVSILLAVVYEMILKFALKVESNFLADKILVDTMILFFIGLHFALGFSKLYDFLIKNRYKIAGILLILFTLLQYSGSSNGILSYCVLEREKNNTLMGVVRGIRSDEHSLETAVAISQKNNDYGYYNDKIRGTATDVFSVIHAPVKDILSIGRLYNIGHIIFQNSGMGVAFSWNLKLLSLILITYELCSLITNKNKIISVVGTIMVTFSGFMQWWSIVDIVIYGELAIVLLNKFMTSEKFSIRILCLLGIAIAAISYIFTFYPPYMVSFGYLFLALAIWIMLKNRKIYKITLKDGCVIGVMILFIVYLCLRYWNLSANTLHILMNTSYPGERSETGGNGIVYLFSYLYNFLLPFMNVGDNCSVASIISIFPIPMIMAIYYIYKKEKHAAFLLPLAIVAVLETVFCISGFPQIISNITLFKYVIVERAAVAVGFANFYILIYMLANIQEELISMKSTIKVSILIMIVLCFVPLPEVIASRNYLSIFAGILCLYTFLFLNQHDSRYRKVLLAFLTIFTLVGGLFVNPITKGVSAVTETKLGKKIQEVTENDPEALWISLDNIMVLSNYAVANGAITMNSTNTYPNEEFFNQVLGKELAEEKKDIWNRYAHIEIDLAEKNDVKLEGKDRITLQITPSKLKELNVKYILTYNNENEVLQKGVKVEKIYEHEVSKKLEVEGIEEDGIYIYKMIEN